MRKKPIPSRGNWRSHFYFFSIIGDCIKQRKNVLKRKKGIGDYLELTYPLHNLIRNVASCTINPKVRLVAQICNDATAKVLYVTRIGLETELSYASTLWSVNTYMSFELLLIGIINTCWVMINLIPLWFVLKGLNVLNHLLDSDSGHQKSGPC